MIYIKFYVILLNNAASLLEKIFILELYYPAGAWNVEEVDFVSPCPPKVRCLPTNETPFTVVRGKLTYCCVFLHWTPSCLSVLIEMVKPCTFQPTTETRKSRTAQLYLQLFPTQKSSRVINLSAWKSCRKCVMIHFLCSHGRAAISHPCLSNIVLLWGGKLVGQHQLAVGLDFLEVFFIASLHSCCGLGAGERDLAVSGFTHMPGCGYSPGLLAFMCSPGFTLGFH